MDINLVTSNLGKVEELTYILKPFGHKASQLNVECPEIQASTLEEVVEHYNSGGEYSSTVDPLMKKLGVGLQLTNQQKQDLVAFLKTLSDTDFITNPDFTP